MEHENKKALSKIATGLLFIFYFFLIARHLIVGIHISDSYKIMEKESY